MGPGRYGGRRPGPTPAGVLEVAPEAPPMAAAAAAGRSRWMSGQRWQRRCDGLTRRLRGATPMTLFTPPSHAVRYHSVDFRRVRSTGSEWSLKSDARAHTHTHARTHASGASGARKRLERVEPQSDARAHWRPTHTYTDGRTNGRTDGRTHARTHAARTHAHGRRRAHGRCRPVFGVGEAGRHRPVLGVGEAGRHRP